MLLNLPERWAMETTANWLLLGEMTASTTYSLDTFSASTSWKALL